VSSWLALALAAVGHAQAPAVQQPAQQGQQPQGEPAAAQQPTFRGGIDFVRVDVIVTDGKEQPVTDLKMEEFEVTEDGKPQTVSQFRLIKVDGNPAPDAPPPTQIRNRTDEELQAARDDVRIFAILLDDYHVRKENAMGVRKPLIEFVRTQLRPNDMVAIMYPLTPVSDLSFTRNHEQIINALEKFEGRKYDYEPRNQFEQQYMRLTTQQVEMIRNDVVMGALRGLSVRLGSLREGRKSLIFVSEGFTAMLPPQMQRQDASAPQDPRQTAAAAGMQDSDRQITAEWFGMADVMQRMREVTDMANRNNTAIYSLDPRGLAVFEFAINDVPFAGPPSFAADSRAVRMTQDTLRVISDDTDGRAIVNRNDLAKGLAQIVRDSSFYYLLGYNSSAAPNDGKFHEIKVRVKRRGVDVRARKGYWAMTVDDVTRAKNPTPDVAKPVQNALAAISTNLQAARYVRTWVGTEKGAEGKTRVTFVWEPMTQGVRRDPPGRVSLLAASESGNLLYRGRSPEAVPATPPTAAQRITFEVPPGKVELRLTVEGTAGVGTLDTENRTIDVPDLTTPEMTISTPRLFRARTVREMQTVAATQDATPAATREFSRTDRVLIRFDAYSAGTERPEATAVLLNRAGSKMNDVPVVAAPMGGTHQLELLLASIPAGEYLVEITVKGASGEKKELVAFRVTA
jgi:VWFA-related protein